MAIEKIALVLWTYLTGCSSFACNGGICDVTAFGARGDGKAVDTGAVRAAAAALAALEQGGVLLFPSSGSKSPARYLTGPFNLTSNAVLRVEAGATVLANTNDEADPWPLVVAPTVWPQFGMGSDCPFGGTSTCRLMRQPFMFAWKVQNLTLEGAGTIDAQGSPFWACAYNLSAFPCAGHARPHFLMVSNASDVRVRGLTFKNSPSWCLHFSSVTGVHVNDISVHNPADAPNSDGIDLDCVQEALVEDSHFDVGDDALCVKSGRDWFGRQYGRPSANITFRRNVILGGHGLTVGSETSGGVTNVTFADMRVKRLGCGPRIKSRRGRGGVVDGIVFKNITMSDLKDMFCITHRYADKGVQPTNQSATPRLQNVLFEDLVFENGKNAGYFEGLPESHILNVTLRNVVLPEAAKFGTCKDLSGGVCEGHTPVCPACFEDRTWRHTAMDGIAIAI